MRTSVFGRINDSELYTTEIIGLLTAIHEYRGMQKFYLKANPEALEALVNVAKVQSTEASNRLEGIHLPQKQLRNITAGLVKPHRPAEQDIAGYWDALSKVQESYLSLCLDTGVILDLHRLMHQHRQPPLGGQLKTVDNAIVEIDFLGNQRLRFSPLPAEATQKAIGELCEGFISASHYPCIDPLLLIPMFILDFLCIHPFSDGNGRLSRLLTHLLLAREGYLVGMYISLEQRIEQTSEAYYVALEKSSAGWHEDRNDYRPFIRYSLGIVLAAYRDFSAWAEALQGNILKTDRVRQVFETRLGSISKSDIHAICPDVSITTIEKALAGLLSQGYIYKLGGGRSTAYVRKDYV